MDDGSGDGTTTYAAVNQRTAAYTGASRMAANPKKGKMASKTGAKKPIAKTPMPSPPGRNAGANMKADVNPTAKIFQPKPAKMSGKNKGRAPGMMQPT